TSPSTFARPFWPWWGQPASGLESPVHPGHTAGRRATSPGNPREAIGVSARGVIYPSPPADRRPASRAGRSMSSLLSPPPGLRAESLIYIPGYGIYRLALPPGTRDGDTLGQLVAVPVADEELGQHDGDIPTVMPLPPAERRSDRRGDPVEL